MINSQRDLCIYAFMKNLVNCLLCKCTGNYYLANNNNYYYLWITHFKSDFDASLPFSFKKEETAQSPINTGNPALTKCPTADFACVQQWSLFVTQAALWCHPSIRRQGLHYHTPSAVFPRPASFFVANLAPTSRRLAGNQRRVTTGRSGDAFGGAKSILLHEEPAGAK